MSITDILENLLQTLNCQEFLDSPYNIEFMPTVIDTKLRVDEISTAVALTKGLLISKIWEMQTGKKQSISVNSAHAAVSIVSAFIQTQNGYPVTFPDAKFRTWPNYPLMNSYRTKDNRFIYIMGPYPHLRDGLLDLLNVPNNAPAVANAIKNFHSEELEAEINKRGLSGVIVRSYDEWLAHPHGKFLDSVPIIHIEKIASSKPKSFQVGEQPLSHLRALDLSHVLSGPMTTRVLAAQGADVLRISVPNLFELLPFSIDTGHGKRNAFLDLHNYNDCEKLHGLIKDADVFLDGFTFGKLANLNTSMKDILAINDSIIYCEMSCYGKAGPLKTWKGFEQCAQAVSGLMVANSTIENPKIISAAACDYITGYLASIGILAALIRRSIEGGSYHVEVSLAKTGMWIQKFGSRADAEIPGQFPLETIDSFMMNSETPYGTIRHLKPIVQYSDTPSKFSYPTSPLGSSLAQWRK